MSIRVGALLVVASLTIALLFGSLFVALGAFMSVCGAIVAAVGMESALLEQGRRLTSPRIGSIPSVPTLPPEHLRHGDLTGAPHG
jgi:hypothetical protein